MKKIEEYIKKNLKCLLLEKIADRDYSFKVQDGDAFLISYPKSGNTWVRFLLANLISEHDIDFVNVENIIRDIYKLSNKAISQHEESRIFKSHSPFNVKYSSNRVVYIVRDVRDVVLSSYYFYNKKNNTNIDFDDFFIMFIEGAIWPKFGTWGENVGSWLGAKSGDQEFLLIKYEDLLTDTYSVVNKICNFLDLKVKDIKIQEAVEKCKFENLKASEIKVENIALATQNTRKDIKFFRKGTSGQWRDVLTEEQLTQLYDKFGYQMKLLGYL